MGTTFLAPSGGKADLPLPGVTQSLTLWARIFTCAWHGALAELLTEGLEVIKSPPLPDGRATPTRQGHFQKWGVWRKHEAEPMYVANSEPTIWQRGGGRACVGVRGLISGEPNRSEVGRDMGRWCVLPREALLHWYLKLRGVS